VKPKNTPTGGAKKVDRKPLQESKVSNERFNRKNSTTHSRSAPKSPKPDVQFRQKLNELNEIHKIVKQEMELDHQFSTQTR
jgi:hypothetical protein